MELVHIGYGRKDARGVLDGLLSVERYMLVDVRFSTASVRRSEWSYDSLRRRYGTQYIWLQSLGNANRFSGGEMCLLDARKGISHVVQLIQQGFTPIILCGCSRYKNCHRQLVIEKVLKEMPDLTVREP